MKINKFRGFIQKAHVTARRMAFQCVAIDPEFLEIYGWEQTLPPAQGNVMLANRKK